MQKFVTTGGPQARRSAKKRTPTPDHHVLSITVEDAALPGTSAQIPTALAPPPPPPPHRGAQLMESQSLRLSLGGPSEEEMESSDHYMTARGLHSPPLEPRVHQPLDPTLDRRTGEGRGPGFLPYLLRDSISTSAPAWTTDASHQSFRHSARLIRSKEFVPNKRVLENRNWFKKSASARYALGERRWEGREARREVRRSGPSRRRRRKTRRQHFDYTMHRWLLLGVLGAFLVWAAIFFPILLAANHHQLPLPRNDFAT